MIPYCMILADGSDGKNLRRYMVEKQLRARGIRDECVLSAMSAIPREIFVPKNLRSLAYDDRPLPIGDEQTISQPYIVGLMCSLLECGENSRILDIGCGSGYQAAILAAMGVEVWGIDINESLVVEARKCLGELNMGKIQLSCGNGFDGWPEYAPFDGIICACAPPKIPLQFLDQLNSGGKLIIPVGNPGFQELVVVRKEGESHSIQRICNVAFVPMLSD